MTDTKMVDNKLQEYNDQVTALWDKLMGLELQLVDQLEVCGTSQLYGFFFQCIASNIFSNWNEIIIKIGA